MDLTVAEIAARLGARVEGDGAAVIRAPAGLREARAGDIAFLANPRYAAAVAGTAASAVLVPGDWQGATQAAVIRVAQPDRAFADVVSWLMPPPVAYPAGIHPSAVIADGVTLGADVGVGPGCVLERGVVVGAGTRLVAQCYLGVDVRIGENCLLYPGVSVREHTRMGSRVILHNGAVIGSDGFGYTPEGGRWVKIPQTGIVVIGDDVEIGANTTIDRARFGETRIGNGVKLDNLIQIAHNVTVGDHTAMAAQVGISGSSSVGAGVRMGGQVGVAGHLHIGDGAIVGAQAGVSKDVPPGIFVLGAPAMPHDKMARMHAHQMRLPKLKEQVARLEERLAELEKRAAE